MKITKTPKNERFRQPQTLEPRSPKAGSLANRARFVSLLKASHDPTAYFFANEIRQIDERCSLYECR
jgi:hypothetical protein